MIEVPVMNLSKGTTFMGRFHPLWDRDGAIFDPTLVDYNDVILIEGQFFICIHANKQFRKCNPISALDALEHFETKREQS